MKGRGRSGFGFVRAGDLVKRPVLFPRFLVIRVQVDAVFEMLESRAHFFLGKADHAQMVMRSGGVLQRILVIEGCKDDMLELLPRLNQTPQPFVDGADDMMGGERLREPRKNFPRRIRTANKRAEGQEVELLSTRTVISSPTDTS